MKDITLVIMAAGMGSRFGGLKQIEPMGPNGEFIIDYSIYDAIKAGFSKVVFIIKKENEQVFKETIGARVDGKIPVEYVFQDSLNIPVEKDFTGRVKPLGTGHAIYCCKDVVREPFAIINSDDYYGQDAFMEMAESLRNLREDAVVMGYKVTNTLTENGAVKRGVCFQDNGKLTNIIESSIIKEGDKVVATPLDESRSFVIPEDSLVSMNMLGFDPNMFEYLTKKFCEFLRQDDEKLKTAEFLIPDVIKDGVLQDGMNVRVAKTNSKWYGVTYKEDKPSVQEGISALVENGVYPNELWSKGKRM